MTTLADVALTCANMLGRANAAGTSILDLETEIKEQIAETVRYHNRKPYHLTEFAGITFSTAAGTVWQHTVGLTSGFGDQDDTRTGVDVNTILSIEYARLQHDSGLYEPLEQIDLQRFERLREGTAPGGTPTYFTLYAGAIGLWPTPDATITVYMHGIIKPAVPTSDVDTSIWFDEAGEMIEAGACKRVCVKYLRDLERGQHFAAIEQGNEQALHAEFIRKNGGGRIKPHD